MTNPPNRGTPDDPRRQPPPDSLGGADAIEKTTYVVGSGTEPERIKREESALKGRGSTGPNATWAIIVFLAVGAVLVYVFGWGR